MNRQHSINLELGQTPWKTPWMNREHSINLELGQTPWMELGQTPWRPPGGYPGAIRVIPPGKSETAKRPGHPRRDAEDPIVCLAVIGMDRDRCRKAHSPILFDDLREMVASDCGCGAGRLPAPHLVPPYVLPPGSSRDLRANSGRRSGWLGPSRRGWRNCYEPPGLGRRGRGSPERAYSPGRRGGNS